MSGRKRVLRIRATHLRARPEVRAACSRRRPGPRAPRPPRALARGSSGRTPSPTRREATAETSRGPRAAPRATGWRSPRARRARRSARDRRGAIPGCSTTRPVDEANARRPRREASEARCPRSPIGGGTSIGPRSPEATRGDYSSPVERGSGWGGDGQFGAHARFASDTERTFPEARLQKASGESGKVPETFRRRSGERPENFSRDARRETRD